MEWITLLIFFYSLRLSTAQSCFGGVESFEKTARASLGPSFDPLPLLQQTDQALTKDCINLCKQQSQCSSFTLNYAAFRCDAFIVNSVNRRDKLILGTEMNFFEKICVKGITKPEYDSLCGDRLWAFERVSNAYLDGYVDKEVRNIQAKEDCLKMCLTEVSFVCRSADYDEQLGLCRMSREDRRSQPQAFREDSTSNRDYLENQCATAAPTSCRYDIRRDVSSASQDKLEYAPNADNCQSQCDSEGIFNCRSYTFVNNKCYLSGDDAVSIGPGPLPAKLDAVYGEKKCVIEQCTRGIFTYEKVTGHELRGAIGTELRTSSPLGKTLDCSEQCKKQGLDCPAFLMNYQTMTCEKLDRNSQGRTADLMPRNSKNYFEKMCLRGPAAQNCANHGWAFERVLGYELKAAYYDHTLNDIPSRRDCEEKCLEERNFVCRSALYNDETTECKLSRFDRRTDPEAYHQMNNPKINYLENQCIPTSLISNCPYVRTGDHYPVYTDYVEMAGITSENACKDYCSKFERFICRSISYYSSNGQCLLSGDDRASSGEKAFQRRQGLVYFERDCKQISPVPTFTPYTTPPSSTLFPPGNEVDRESFKPQGTEMPQCGPGERYIFQKVTGFESVSSAQSPLYRGPPDSIGITSQCASRCSQDPDCRHFVLDYFRQECHAVRIDPGSGLNDLRPFLGRAFFEGHCLPPTVECNRLWAIERVPDHELRGAQPLDIQRPITRAECQQRCLEERRFVCKSANYYSASRECRLFGENRMSSPSRLQYANSVDYLENQCIAEPTSCSYGPVQRDVYMIYNTKTIQGASSTFQCEQECSREQEFVCRSYTYVDYGAPGSGRCMLSAESRVTDQAKALEQRRRFIYAEKDCTRQARQSSTVYPPTSIPTRPQPKPFPQPTPFPILCTPEQFTYERVLGFDSRQMRKERVRTRNQMGVVSECQRECQRLGERCRGFVLHYANFQTCWWMDTPAGDDPGALTPSAESVYFEKICLKERHCGKMWTFERMLNHELQSSAEREIQDVTRRSDCQDLCLSERNFICRSATYSHKNSLCKLYSETRRTNPGSFQKTDAGIDYLENQCAPEPTTCQYRDYVERFFPFIDRLTRAFTLPDCQHQCDTERQFTCRSVNFETVTRDCALSSADTTSAYTGQNSITFRRNSIYSEKGTCEQVSVQCNQQDMVLTMNFGSPFSGRVYAKGNPAQCFVVGTSQTTQQFAISLGSRCGTRLEGTGRYVNEVVIQQHPIIMTDNDKTIQVVCSFDASDRTVTLGSPVGVGPPGVDVTLRFQPTVASVVENTVPPPLVAMRITDKTGRDAKVVGLGDELSLRIELQEQNTKMSANNPSDMLIVKLYGTKAKILLLLHRPPDSRRIINDFQGWGPTAAFAISARNLYARSSNGESLFLIDASGCPTDAAIFPGLQLDERDKKALTSEFKAFRFPSTGTVNFEVQIRFCQDQCQPIRCQGNIESFGRRRRRRSPKFSDSIIDNKGPTEETISNQDFSSESNQFHMSSSPIIVPQSAVLIGGQLYQKDLPLSSLSTEAMATLALSSLKNNTSIPVSVTTAFPFLNTSREPVGPAPVLESQAWFSPNLNGANDRRTYHQMPKEIDDLPSLPVGGKPLPHLQTHSNMTMNSTSINQQPNWNSGHPQMNNVHGSTTGAFGFDPSRDHYSGYANSQYPGQSGYGNPSSHYPGYSSGSTSYGHSGYGSGYTGQSGSSSNVNEKDPSHPYGQSGYDSRYSGDHGSLSVADRKDSSHPYGLSGYSGNYDTTTSAEGQVSPPPYSPSGYGSGNSDPSVSADRKNSQGKEVPSHYGPSSHGSGYSATQQQSGSSTNTNGRDPYQQYGQSGYNSGSPTSSHSQYPSSYYPSQYPYSHHSSQYPYHGQQSQYPARYGNSPYSSYPQSYNSASDQHSSNGLRENPYRHDVSSNNHNASNNGSISTKQEPSVPDSSNSNYLHNKYPPFAGPQGSSGSSSRQDYAGPYQNRGPYSGYGEQSKDSRYPYNHYGNYGGYNRADGTSSYPDVTEGIFATTEKPVPQEMPLSLSIMVAPEKGEDSSWSIERIPRPAVSSTTESPEALCPSQTTIVATAVTVTIVHIGIVGAAICWYRWNKKKGVKREMEDDVAPFPVRAHQPATISAAASQIHAGPPVERSRPSVSSQGFYASPEVTFRSVYGVYESPP